MNYETYQHIECQVKTHIYLLRLMFLIFYNCTKYHTLTCNYDYVTRLVSGGDVLSTGDKCPLTAWSWPLVPLLESTTARCRYLTQYRAIYMHDFKLTIVVFWI